MGGDRGPEIQSAHPGQRIGKASCENRFQIGRYRSLLRRGQMKRLRWPELGSWRDHFRAGPCGFLPEAEGCLTHRQRGMGSLVWAMVSKYEQNG